MIFTAIGLLVVALIMLIAGIVRSSTALLTLSVLATSVACVVLYASFRYYRAKAAEEAGTVGTSPPGWPAAYRSAAHGAGPAVASTLLGAPVAADGSAVGGAGPAAVPGWDSLQPGDAARMVDTLNLDELHAVRRHEVEHGHRADLLAALDVRIDVIVGLRRSVSSSG